MTDEVVAKHRHRLETEKITQNKDGTWSAGCDCEFKLKGDAAKHRVGKLAYMDLIDSLVDEVNQLKNKHTPSIEDVERAHTINYHLGNPQQLLNDAGIIAHMVSNHSVTLEKYIAMYARDMAPEWEPKKGKK